MKETLKVEINGTWYELGDEIVPFETIALGIFYILLISIAILGNLFICKAVLNYSTLKKLGNLFIISLAIADILLAIVMAFAAMHDIFQTWKFGSFLCDLWIALDVTCSTALIFNLCAIAIERFIYLKDPTTYRQWIYKGTVTKYIAIIWIVSFTISLLPLAFHFNFHNNIHILEDNAIVCLIKFPPSYAIISTCVSFGIPTIIMLYIYLKLYKYDKKIKRRMKRTLSVIEDNPNKIKKYYTFSDYDATKTVGVLITVYLICWFPFFTVNIIHSLCGCTNPYVFLIFTWLGYSNCALNPIIYLIFHKEFRNALLHYLMIKS